MKFSSWVMLMQQDAHNHFTRDMKAFGKCPACDKSHLINRVWRMPT